MLYMVNNYKLTVIIVNILTTLLYSKTEFLLIKLIYFIHLINKYRSMFSNYIILILLLILSLQKLYRYSPR